MKICPSCGAELGENDTRCPICDFLLPVTESSDKKAEIPEKGVSGLLDDVKARIQRIAGLEPDEGPEAPEHPIVEKEIEENRSDSLDRHIEEEEVKAEAQQEGSFTITSRPIHGELKLPGMANEEKKPPKEPDKLGYKINAEFSGKKAGRKRILVASSIIVVLMIILTYWFFIIPSQSPVKPVIDGYFDDWANSVKYESYMKSDNSEIDFKECAVQLSDNTLFWYFSTKGALFNASSQTSPLISTYSLFIDADGNPDTGFPLIQGFGADDVAVIAGSSGKNTSMTRLYEFYGPDRDNWSSWRALNSIVVGSIGKQVETSFHTPLYFDSSFARYMAFSYDGVSTPSSTLPFSLSPGILLIKQTSLVYTNDVIWAGTNRPLLSVTLTGFGTALPIAEIHPTVSGVSETYNLGSVKWNESQMKTGVTFLFTVNTTALPAGTLVKATILPTDVISDYKSIVVIGDPAEGYITSIPIGLTIDGIFSDWKNFESDGHGAALPSNIDIDRTSNSTGVDKSNFYIDVLGGMLQGALIPVEKIAPSPSMSSNPWSDKKVTGEDIIEIYFDIDPGANKGAPSPLNGTALRPDMKIEICGRNGKIDVLTVESWDAGWHVNHSVGITAAVGGKMIEIGVSSVNLSNAKYAIVFSDWIGNKDNATGSL